jgi:hypothetical protein
MVESLKYGAQDLQAPPAQPWKPWWLSRTASSPHMAIRGNATSWIRGDY